MKKPLILVVDDDPEVVKSLVELLEDENYRTITATCGEEALQKIPACSPSLVLLDIYMPGIDGLETLSRITKLAPHVPVIMISGQATIDNAVKATRLGAADFVEKPISPERLLVSVRNAIAMKELKEENLRLAEEVKKHRMIVGESEPIKKLKNEIQKAAPTKSRVLIFGENGTGKELVAHAIHENSPRKNKPFVKLNCAAIPKDLIESELFGYEKGAFTGATTRKPGKFELADGGTLLLDEIGDMNLETQAKLLRVLEENEIERLGGKSPIGVDVRVISSTNKELKVEIEKGKFRADLFYRISVIPIRVPPLRERKDDIPLLVEHFTTIFSEENNKPIMKFTGGAMKVLMAYDWPGNVRELKNLVERLIIMSEKDVIEEDEVASMLKEAPLPRTADRPLRELLEEFERSIIIAELKRSGWNVSRAAARLGVERANLHRKMRRYSIERPEDGVSDDSTDVSE